MPPAAFEGLSVRLLAGDDGVERVKRYDPITGQAYLADASTWALDDPATHVELQRPLVGMVIVGDPPKRTCLNTTWVDKRRAEGFVSLEGEQLVHRPGGPPADPWRVTHTFRHADAIVLHCQDGDVRYEVTQQPDKWPAVKNEQDEGFGGDVRWYYEVKLV